MLVSIGWAVGGALALAVAFPAWNAWFLAPAGPAGLLLAVRGRRLRVAFSLGVLFGAVFFAVLLTWLTNLGLAPWLLLTALQSLVLGLLGVAVALAWRYPGRLIAVPCAWVAVEALRARFPLGGFPWGRLGFSQADAPTARWVSIGGIPLLSWVVAVVGTVAVATGLAMGVSRLRRTATVVAAVGLAALGTLVLPGGGIDGAAPDQTGGAPSTVTIAVVQGNVPRGRTMVEQARAARVTENHVDATYALAARVRAGAVPAPDLVIWPESSTDVDPERDPRVRELIAGAVAAIDRPILVGAILDSPDGRGRNVGQLWVPGAGPGATYQKRHLVPFGEYIPFRGLLGGIGPLSLIPRDFVPGTGPQIITSGAMRIGDVICYEVAYDDEALDAVRAGANLLVVQSNNASFMRDFQVGETLQQLAMSRLRALEHDRAVAVATTTGISALIRPDGTVQAQTDIWQAETLVGQVELRTTRTVASRLGAWPELLLSAGLIAVPLAGSAARAWRGRFRVRLRQAPGPHRQAGNVLEAPIRPVLPHVDPISQRNPE